MIIATMQLYEAGPIKCLAGHSADTESVFVLRKQTANEYALHQVPLTDAEQALRAILSADQSEAGELVAAILQTCEKITKPRKRRRKA